MMEIFSIKKFIPELILDKLYLLRVAMHQYYGDEQRKRYVNKVYKRINGKNINWSNPQTYTEKININKLYRANEIKRMLSDKLTVREWVKSKIGAEYLVPLLGVYTSFDEIKRENLPEKFVIKCNHDSGSTTIVESNNLMTEKEWKRLGKKYNNFFLKRNFAFLTFEMQYEKIVPHLLVEKYMGSCINDYKFLCFNGKPYFCWVDFDRFGNHKRNIYDLEWNLQPFNQMTYGNYEGEVNKPSKFSEMLQIAKCLCEGFDHVRVDLYEIDEKVYFGEMTFTNGNGMEIITPSEWDFELGRIWNQE